MLHVNRIVIIAMAGALSLAAASRQDAVAPIVPVQLSMGRPGLTPVPPTRRQVAAPAQRTSGAATAKGASAQQPLTADEQKLLTKALKHLSPSERARFIEAMKKRLAQGSAPATPTRAR